MGERGVSSLKQQQPPGSSLWAARRAHRPASLRRAHRPGPIRALPRSAKKQKGEGGEGRKGVGVGAGEAGKVEASDRR